MLTEGVNVELIVRYQKSVAIEGRIRSGSKERVRITGLMPPRQRSTETDTLNRSCLVVQHHRIELIHYRMLSKGQKGYMKLIQIIVEAVFAVSPSSHSYPKLQ
jgi:hypothetical protein